MRKVYAGGVSEAGSTRSIVAYSQAKERDYTMECTAGHEFVTCTGGENAIVYVY
ncbi:hypothetical protein ACLMAL_17310 [Nocardia sp. CWNU-33]|uniref:hypothetical protein n=1 Tax=Nocardia sp. CWNU-33 TaxID=3392117 RepID=UPI00398E4E8B